MKRRFAIVGSVLALLIGGGVAYAYIPSTGTGAGTAASGSLSAVTISATASTPVTALLPGESADAIFKVDNPNAVAMTIVSVVGSGSISVSGGSGCTSGNDGVAFVDQGALSISVPANSTDFSVDLSGAVTMSSSSDTGCQGASFSIPITLTVHRG